MVSHLHRESIVRLRFPLILLLLVSSACMDSARVNESCMWTEQSSQRLDLSRRADRDHLRADVQLAGELGVRLADVRYRGRADLADPIQERCTAAMMDTIAQRHGVAAQIVTAAAQWRVWWADLLAVYLPLAVIVAFGMDRVTRRMCHSFDPEDRRIAVASLVVLVPFTAVVGLGVGQFWGFGVESFFLRNGHVAFRAFLVPIIRHGWIGYFSMLLLCVGVAIHRFVRTPLQDVGRSYASQRRSRAVVKKRVSS
jgi:hypothetical protein